MKNEKAIREAAYYIWQNAGCPQGNDEYFWALAIEQLGNNKSVKKSPAKKAKKAPAKKASSSLLKRTSSLKK